MNVMNNRYLNNNNNTDVCTQMLFFLLNTMKCDCHRTETSLIVVIDIIILSFKLKVTIQKICTR